MPYFYGHGYGTGVVSQPKPDLLCVIVLLRKRPIVRIQQQGYKYNEYVFHSRYG